MGTSVGVVVDDLRLTGDVTEDLCLNIDVTDDRIVSDDLGLNCRNRITITSVGIVADDLCLTITSVGIVTDDLCLNGRWSITSVRIVTDDLLTDELCITGRYCAVTDDLCLNGSVSKWSLFENGSDPLKNGCQEQQIHINNDL
ncbi:hypothetical protein DPMN_179923 [Dreissena polymorpha]|uniref:Uncharacterized protein n=1 Tax=Dreissena polymorpha TaxID=45954 RepID=A0A9D4ED89_DREPO|nr:hypothetical protein DPMN_179923 [Dreissena polymorpha]